MLQNLSTRARVEGGDKVMIAGFIIGGSASGGPIDVVMRGLGPSVPVNASKLGDPVIELHYPNKDVDTNNSWQSDDRQADLIAAGLQPANSSEAAMIRSLEPGRYTVILRDAGSAYGVGVIELYALGDNEQSRLQNISTRCWVGTDDNVAIAGMTIGNTGAGVHSLLPKPHRRVLIFGKGPSLNQFGVQGFLADPKIQVLPNGESNDQWRALDDDSGDFGALEEELNEAGFAPSCTGQTQQIDPCAVESALWPTFDPGVATVKLSGANNTTGIGLIEFYEK